MELSQSKSNESTMVAAARDSEESIAEFNRVFGPVGVLHPDTQPDKKPRLDHMNEHDRQVMRREFPGVFTDEE